MIRLHLETAIAAPVDRCFDLSRSIDLHISSTEWTGERAIAGVTSGLIGNGQTVTWKARFYGLPATHTSVISAFDPPRYFQDSMVRGWFHSYRHDHYFVAQGNGTLMKDEVQFSAPLGILGRVVERLVLERYLRKLIERRNRHIKLTAESGLEKISAIAAWAPS